MLNNFSEKRPDGLCQRCWKQNLPWRCPNQNRVSVIYSRPQRAASFLHLNSTLPQSGVCAGVMGGGRGQGGKTIAVSLTWDLRCSHEFWNCSAPYRKGTILKSTILLTLSLHKGSVVFPPTFKRQKIWQQQGFQNREFTLFSSGLTSRTRTHLHPPKYHGTACALCHRILPFQWDFLIVSTNSPIRKPVGCMQLFCCILILTLPPLSHSHSCKRHTDTVLLRRKNLQLP